MDNRRYYGLDALRGAMMMLGIVLHGSQFYIANPPLPIPTDANTSPIFTVIVIFIHDFRMPLFFVLAGFFTSLLVEKYEVRGSFVNRLKRIGGPLLVGALTIVPLTGYFLVSAMVSIYAGERQLFTSLEQAEVVPLDELAAAGMKQEPSVAHLWFLYYLLWFYLLIPVCKLLVEWTVRVGLEARLRKLAASPWLMPLLGLYTAATLWTFPNGLVFEGFMYLTPHLGAMLYYGSFFVIGYVFHHYRDVLDAFTRWFGVWTAAALLLFPLAMFAAYREVGAPFDATNHLISVVLNGLVTWALIYFFMGLFLKYVDFESPWILYISQSSYWVYIIHMPIVVMVAWFLLGFDLAAELKFLIVVSITTVVAFLTYHYMVRKSWVSVLLNGRTFDLDWPWRVSNEAPRKA